MALVMNLIKASFINNPSLSFHLLHVDSPHSIAYYDYAGPIPVGDSVTYEETFKKIILDEALLSIKETKCFFEEPVHFFCNKKIKTEEVLELMTPEEKDRLNQRIEENEDFDE